MSYDTYMELPPQVRKAFSVDDAHVWMEVYNSAYLGFIDKNKNDGGDYDTRAYRHAYYEAWKAMRYAKSSRSFVVQVSVEEEDDVMDTPDIVEYVSHGDYFIHDGGIGTDSHSSKNVWCIWDVMKGVDEFGADAMIVQGNFFRDRPGFDISWQRFLKGRSQFSLGSYAESERVCDMFKCVNKIRPHHLFEISIVDVGASPNTGVISVHVPEGEGEYIDRNPVAGSEFKLKGGETSDICVLEEIYHGLREELLEVLELEKSEWEDELTHPVLKDYSWIDGIGIHISIYNLKYETIWNTLLDWSEGVYALLEGVSQDPLMQKDLSKGQAYTEVIMVPYKYFTPFDELTISTLITDEQEAIRAYDIAIEEAKVLFGDEREDAIEILTHIRDEEYEHIDELLELLILHNYSRFNAEGDEEGPRLIEVLKNRMGTGVKGDCPAGQHWHEGTEGCHDVMRVHTDLISSMPENKLDLTDEPIDVNAIKNISTPKLKAIVLAIAKVLSSFPDEKVEEYMQSTGGKEFTLMFTELVNRSRQSSDTMEGKEKKMDVKEKALVDPVTDYSALLTVIHELKTRMEHLTATVQSLQGDVMSNQEQAGNISDAVATAVNSLGSPEAEDGGSAVGNAEGGNTTITEGGAGDVDAVDVEGMGAPIGNPEAETAEATIPSTTDDLKEPPKTDGEDEGDSIPEVEPGGDEPKELSEDDPEEGEDEGGDDEDSEPEEGEEEGEKKKKDEKKEGDNMSEEERKKVDEKTKSGEPSTEAELEVKEGTGEAGVGGEPGITETLGEEDGGKKEKEPKVKEATGGEDGEEVPEGGEPEVKEAGGDAFAPIANEAGTGNSGIVNETIPETPCDAPETSEGTPSIDLGGAGKQEDGAGVGVSPGGSAQVGPGANIDAQGGKPAEVGAGETLKGSGIPADNVLPTEIPKGPLEQKLEEVSMTEPTRDPATWEQGCNFDTGLDTYLKASKEFLSGKGDATLHLKSGGTVERTVNSVETQIEYKSGSEDVIVVTPETESLQGTGLKLSEGGSAMGGRNFEALWNAIGTDDKTFSKIKDEVLR